MTVTAGHSHRSGNVYILDDDYHFRRSAGQLVEAAGWLAHCFGSVTEFLEEAGSLRPGPLLLDVKMPEMCGVDVLEERLFPTARFPTVVVTGHGDIESAVRSLKAGAVDFLEKPFSVDDLLKAIDAASARLAMPASDPISQRDALERTRRLTQRELQVLGGLLGGLPYKLIAHELLLSVRTVEMHRNRLLRKLGAATNADGVRIAVLAGIEPMRSRH